MAATSIEIKLVMQGGGDYQEGSANYNVIRKWNKATLYQKTIAKLAREIRG